MKILKCCCRILLSVAFVLCLSRNEMLTTRFVFQFDSFHFHFLIAQTRASCLFKRCRSFLAFNLRCALRSFSLVSRERNFSVWQPHVIFWWKLFSLRFQWISKQIAQFKRKKIIKISWVNSTEDCGNRNATRRFPMANSPDRQSGRALWLLINALSQLLYRWISHNFHPCPRL